MKYSRRQFLKLVAAGVPVAAASPLILGGTAQAESSHSPGSPLTKSQGPARGTKVLGTEKQYSQEKADEIHELSVERQIRKAGKTPEEVKAEVDRRIRELRPGMRPIERRRR